MENVRGVESLSSGERSSEGLVLVGLPMPPSENHVYPSGADGRRFASPELKRYKQSMRDWRMINLQKANLIKRVCDVWLMEGNVLSLELVLGFHVSSLFTKKGEVKQMDASNRIKAFQDGLFEEILGIDDRYAWSVRVMKMQIPEELPEQSWCMIQSMPIKMLPKGMTKGK